MMKRKALKIKVWLSHHPMLFALVGGVGVIVFWRGVWISVDYVMEILAANAGGGTINMTNGLWWDGPLSTLVGALILMTIGAFVSSLIGNEIIIGGLRAERSIAEKEGRIIKTENVEIDDIRHNVEDTIEKLDELEKDIEAKAAEKKRQ